MGSRSLGNLYITWGLFAVLVAFAAGMLVGGVVGWLVATSLAWTR